MALIGPVPPSTASPETALHTPFVFGIGGRIVRVLTEIGAGNRALTLYIAGLRFLIFPLLSALVEPNGIEPLLCLKAQAPARWAPDSPSSL